ncbi:solute carrier family 66 member 2 isoform X3 [Halyomorpha halys]|uniref:solute carrier family 66 member 2 isoform X3 n=1 Tax=Halyomorpha halys TaxID=286706 RepID=UPI0006D4C886|nr:PQ-loop repeat-containing protein 1 isoform X3 [Halyomorpha halys]
MVELWNGTFQLNSSRYPDTMDYILEEVQEITLPKVIKWISSTVMIFGGVAPFIPQYREIKRKNDAEGFSLYVCLALLIANTLRILFWFGKRYELPLLAQSMIMNMMMLLMIHLCVKVKNRSQIIRGPDRVFTGVGPAHDEMPLRPKKREYPFDFDWKYFWAWTDFQSYIDFLLVVSLVMSLLTFLLLDFIIYVEILGFLALFMEAMLAVPQLVKNFKSKSTEGMSILMVLMWTVGDVFKTTYFILREAPAQFWLCGGLQVLIDITILGQVWLYHKWFQYGKPTMMLNNIKIVYD